MSDEHVRCRERQQRTADYAAHWRREAERTERSWRAVQSGSAATMAFATRISNMHTAELDALRARVAVLEEALRLSEAAIEVTT